MSSVWTFRLKRRKRFSIDSPSCDRTSAKSASRNAVTRYVSSVPYKAWPGTLQPIHRSFCNEHPYVHGNELRTASMTTTDAGMYSCAGLSRRYFTTVRTAWFVETLDGTQGMVHQRCFFVFFQHLHGTVHVMNAHDVTDAQRSPDFIGPLALPTSQAPSHEIRKSEPEAIHHSSFDLLHSPRAGSLKTLHSSFTLLHSPGGQ